MATTIGHRSRIASVIILLALCCAAARLRAQSIAGVINSYVSVTGINYSTSTLNLDPTSSFAFAAGDEVLLIQMNGADIDGSNTSTYGTVNNYHGAGHYEFGIVAAVKGTVVTLTKPFANTDYAPAPGALQLIKVPHYDQATITTPLTCGSWNGRTGGVLVFSANCVTMLADIDVSGMGFAGGRYLNQPGCAIVPNTPDYVSAMLCSWSPKGEGIASFGKAPETNGKGSPANGGGGGNNHNAGGGGGGNFGDGGAGGSGYNGFSNENAAAGLGGKPLAGQYANMGGRIFMGGGGGAGHINNNHGSGGAIGGGIVIIRAGTIQSNGHAILARGAKALDDPAPDDPDGCGGGGGGGVAILNVAKLAGQLTVDASGGNGGSRTVSIAQVGPGGGGGGGYVAVTGDSVSCLNVIVEGGKAGTAVEGGTYDATNGGPGYYATKFYLTGEAAPIPACSLAGCSLLVGSTPPSYLIEQRRCFDVSVLALDSAWDIDSIAVDSTTNIKITVQGPIPSRSVHVLAQVVDHSKGGTFSFRIRNTSGEWVTVSDSIATVASGGIDVLSAMDNGAVRLDTVFLTATHCQSVHIRNSGIAPLVIPAAAMRHNGNFSIPPSQFPIVIAPGSAADITVCFAPNLDGDERDTMDIPGFCAIEIPVVATSILAGNLEGEICHSRVGFRMNPAGKALVRIAPPYPNPVSSLMLVPVTFLGDRGVALDADCHITDALGRVMARGTYHPITTGFEGASVQESGEYAFDVDGLPQGAYFVIVRTPDGTGTLPVVIVR